MTALEGCGSTWRALEVIIVPDRKQTRVAVYAWPFATVVHTSTQAVTLAGPVARAREMLELGPEFPPPRPPWLGVEMAPSEAATRGKNCCCASPTSRFHREWLVHALSTAHEKFQNAPVDWKYGVDEVTMEAPELSGFGHNCRWVVATPLEQRNTGSKQGQGRRR